MHKTIPPSEALINRSYQEIHIAHLCSECEQERLLYASAQQDISPACVELVRRALAGDNEAWSVFQVLFMPLMRAWIGTSGAEETEDILRLAREIAAAPRACLYGCLLYTSDAADE